MRGKREERDRGSKMREIEGGKEGDRGNKKGERNGGAYIGEERLEEGRDGEGEGVRKDKIAPSSSKNHLILNCPG